MDKIDIKNLSTKELETRLGELVSEPYRARQISRWLYAAGVKHFDEMTDISASLRSLLKSKFHLTHLTALDSRRSRMDGTTKYLFKLEDGNTIETVFLPEKERATICLSSQVGCKFGCVFCASAPFGFVRNLTASEIIEEVLSVKRENPSANITNLVFMGIGEPFDNYDNVMKAVRIFNSKDGFNIGARRMTISTCGVIPGIKRLETEGLQIELSISLHSADNAVRSKLVPVNKKYPLSELIDACRHYTECTNRVITFEYVLIKGMNSSAGDASKLIKLLRGMKAKVNLICYNRIRAKNYEVPSETEVKAFVETLKKGGINVTRRKSKGDDIDAGCGQLRISRL